MSLVVPECSANNSLFHCRHLLTVFVVVCCWLFPVTFAHGWQAELAEAEQAQQYGRYYAARDILEPLAAEHPEVGRIRLELAVVYLSLYAFEAAMESVDQVLVRSDLPDAVAANARLLRLTIQRQQARTEEPDDTLSLAAYGDFEPAQTLQVGTQASISRRQYQGQMRLLDRPLRQYWQISLDADQSWQPTFDTTRYHVQPKFSLVHRWAQLDTRLGAGADFTDQDSAPILRAQIGWTPVRSLRLYLDQRWRRDSAWLSLTSTAGVRWRFDSHWSLTGDWQYRHWSPIAEDDGFEIQTRTSLGLGLNFQNDWQTGLSLRAPVTELQTVNLTYRLSVPLSPQRWFLDNRIDLPVSSVGSGQVADELSWRTGVRWQL